MDVTVFKNISAINTPFYFSVLEVLERIKGGNSKEFIESIRKEDNAEKRNNLKKNLPSICFSGKFTKRNDSALIEHSGLICLDFDKFKSKKEMKDFDKFVRKDKYTFASFVSPSGNGYKLLIKIPTEETNHKMYFDALKDYYESDYFDTTSKNISRVCYESYDPRLFINKESELWTNKAEFEKFDIRERNPIIRVEGSDDKIRGLMVWFNKKYSMASGERNNNLFILACAFNQYGIPKMDSVSHCLQYEQEGFSRHEIEALVGSAYQNVTEFGTKYFENTKAAANVSRKIRNGISKKEIKKYLEKEVGMNEDASEEAIAEIEKDNSVNKFWTEDKKGNIKIDPYKYKVWLMQNGFYKLYPEGTDTFVFVRKVNNLVKDTSEAKMKDFVLSYLEKKDNISIYNYFTDKTKFFKEDYLSLLDNLDINFNTDTQKESYIYFKNGAVKVTPKGHELTDYMHLDGYVWEKHIVDRDFLDVEDYENDFSKLLFNISGQDESKEKSIKSTIGYLLHSYKSGAKNVAVILNDELISENPNGGTGKGIFINAISKLKRVVVIDGKAFDSTKSFPYQTVSADTHLLVFDDVKKSFNFENLFSLITEGITLEKKNKDAIKLPIENSPKIMISTNYAIKGDGSSFERRKWDLEFAQYYQKNKTPEDEFGRLLFDDWGSDDWTRFDNYMMECLRLYLTEGLVESEFNNLMIRRFIAKTSYDFYEWANEDGNLPTDIRMYRTEKFNNFIDENSGYKNKLTQRRFTSWVHDFGIFKGYDVFSGRTTNSRWTHFDTKGKDPNKEEEDVKEEIESGKLPF